MAEHVASSIVGFVRAVVEAEPFTLTPTQTPYGFDLQPADNVDGTYRLVPATYRAIGALNFYETRFDTFDLWFARAHGGDTTATLDGLMLTCTSLVAAIAREGIVRDYDLMDEGRGSEVAMAPGQSFALARITLPLSYAARL